jgi:hypothetical protein
MSMGRKLSLIDFGRILYVAARTIFGALLGSLLFSGGVHSHQSDRLGSLLIGSVAGAWLGYAYAIWGRPYKPKPPQNSAKGGRADARAQS